MNFGEKIIYMERWPIIGFKILYYLFDIPSSYDPLHNALCATDPKYLSTIPNFNTFQQTNTLTHGSEIYFVDDLKFSKTYSDNEFNQQKKIIRYFLKNSNVIEQLYENQWDFYDEYIRTFKIGYKKLCFKINLFRIITKIKNFFSFFLFPLLLLPLLDFYFLFIHYREYKITGLKLKISQIALNEYKKYPLSQPQNRNMQNVKDNLDRYESKIAILRESILTSNRAISTLILSVLTIFYTIVFFQNKEGKYENTISEKEKNIELLIKEVKDIKELNKNLEIELNKISLEQKKIK